MDGYLLDTCTLSALLDALHGNYEAVKRADEAIEPNAPRYVSRISIAFDPSGVAVTNERTGWTQTRPALGGIAGDILDAGGLVPYLRREVVLA